MLFIIEDEEAKIDFNKAAEIDKYCAMAYCKRGS